MEITDFVETLRREGRLLADAADRAGPDASVPACPDWQVRDLLAHIGSVHRWATGYVTGASEDRTRPPAAPDLDGTELVEWVRDGHRALVDALDAAPAGLACWTFLSAPSPLAFWARRQAHETAMHRIDAETALGAGFSALDPAFAADGIDELLTGFLARDRGRARTAPAKELYIRTTDAPGPEGSGNAAWRVRLSDAPPHTERVTATGEGAGPADGTSEAVGPAPDCVLEGPAADLYAMLWNRLPWQSSAAVTVKPDDDGSSYRLWQQLFTV
ncbi:maleylpyruvate isomerase family mycothiol-dependent enzyme [Streptomyces sp. CA-132043]|uniref:maleylpyruvate isomerase family mycothiol-dependent enzyme n=1 Tax=Streptomyces sp. CA-132043 TaxID=3240048 RepID=UPI003D8C8BFF